MLINNSLKKSNINMNKFLFIFFIIFFIFVNPQTSISNEIGYCPIQTQISCPLENTYGISEFILSANNAPLKGINTNLQLDSCNFLKVITDENGLIRIGYSNEAFGKILKLNINNDSIVIYIQMKEGCNVSLIDVKIIYKMLCEEIKNNNSDIVNKINEVVKNAIANFLSDIKDLIKEYLKQVIPNDTQKIELNNKKTINLGQNNFEINMKGKKVINKGITEEFIFENKKHIISIDINIKSLVYSITDIRVSISNSIAKIISENYTNDTLSIEIQAQQDGYGEILITSTKGDIYLNNISLEVSGGVSLSSDPCELFDIKSSYSLSPVFGDEIDFSTPLSIPITIEPDPNNLDNDGDGLTNGEEKKIGTDPDKKDSDGDDWNDKEDPYPTDPNKPPPDGPGDPGTGPNPGDPGTDPSPEPEPEPAPDPDPPPKPLPPWPPWPPGPFPPFPPWPFPPLPWPPFPFPPGGGGDYDNPDPTFLQMHGKVYKQSFHTITRYSSPTSSRFMNDTVDIEYDLSQSSLISLIIYNYNGEIVRTILSNELRDAGTQLEQWDGTDETNTLVEDGKYYFLITNMNAMNSRNHWSQMGIIVIDNILPTIQIDHIKANLNKYDEYEIIGSVFDENLHSYRITCYNDNENIFYVFKRKNVHKGTLGVINTTELQDGNYTMYLLATDHADNYTTKEIPFVLDRENSNHSIYINSIKQNQFFGTNNQVQIYDLPEVWIDDELPSGSTILNEWEWDSTIVYNGSKSHSNPYQEGVNGHCFIHADNTYVIKPNENIIQYAYLDPDKPPQQIMLQFYINDGDSAHRAYWGDNLIPVSEEPGSSALYYMGQLPPKGKWIRLKIVADLLGLAGTEIKGIAFLNYGGKVFWDKSTKSIDHYETQKKTWLDASKLGSDEHSEYDISYTISNPSNVNISIYDNNNNLVKTLQDDYKEVGTYQLTWDSTNESGYHVSNGNYYLQITSSDNLFIDSNSYCLSTDQPSSIDSVEQQDTVIDSEGNRFEIHSVTNKVNKYNSSGDLLFTIGGDNVHLDNFQPIALGLDENDNIYIIEKNSSILLKFNRFGHLVNHMPSLNSTNGLDQRIHFVDPVAVSVNNDGSVLIRQEDDSILKLIPACAVINILDIYANIRIPSQNSLVSYSVPIIGSACAKNFEKYKVEYGIGDTPLEWRTLLTSKTERYDRYKPIPPSRTVYGNLATWHTAEIVSWAGAGDDYYVPMDRYTIRLTVFNAEGENSQDQVQIDMSKVVGRWKSKILSNDGLFILNLPYASIADDYDLFSIQSVESSDAPPVDSSKYQFIGKIYQLKPPGYQFIKSCSLKVFYKEQDLNNVSESSINLFKWNTVTDQWVYADAEIDLQNNCFTTKINSLSHYKAFYAIMRNQPDRPIIYEQLSPISLDFITVAGESTPGISIELFVNDENIGLFKTDEDSGLFLISGIKISNGNNQITARSIDSQNNASQFSDPVFVEYIQTQSVNAYSISFKTSDFSQDMNDPVNLGDFLYIELVGDDVNPEKIDTVDIIVKNNHTNPDGIKVPLLETSTASGVFRGAVFVGSDSVELLATIGASSDQTDTISVNYLNLSDSIQTKDTVPPNAPIITSATHPSLVQDTFEIYLKFSEWNNMSETYGASLLRTEEATSSGVYSLKLVNTNEGGDFACYVRDEPFDAKQYPVISFDYKIPDNLKLNLIANVNGMLKEIVFTDDPKTVETFTECLYRTIGKVNNIIQDNQWHHAEFNLYDMLRKDDPNQTDYIVEELFLADYNLPAWLELKMGDENTKDTTYFIDNFIITAGGQSKNNPTFSWIPNDLSTIEYSYVFDQVPDTMPDTTTEGANTFVTYNDVPDGIWYFHVRSLDAGGNFGPPNHYKILIDTEGPVASTPKPGDNSKSGDLDVQIMINDNNGSGVNPDSIVLEINNVQYDINSGGLYFDEQTKVLHFELWKVNDTPEHWKNGETVNAKLISASDHAGNTLSIIYSWSWTVDYSKFDPGYLTILTTKGGMSPSWSFDGNRIAFMSERTQNQDIWTIQADDYAELNESAQQITNDEADDHHPAYSPIDNKLVFVSNRDGYDHLYMINLDNNELLKLTSENFDDSHPAWSPDGNNIAFSREGELWNIDIQSLSENQLTFNSIQYNLEPHWSPDGLMLVFTKSLYQDDVAYININENLENSITNGGFDRFPTWADNNEILFASTLSNGSSSIYIVNKNGSTKENFILNDNMWWDTEPIKSPINNTVAFQSTRNGTWNIWLTSQIQLADIQVMPNPFSPNGNGSNDTTTILFKTIHGKPELSVSIFDQNNNLIRKLIDKSTVLTGDNSVTWDGKDNYGEIVEDGAYQYTIFFQNDNTNEMISETGNIIVDTTPPIFTDWVIFKDIIAVGPQQISVNITDLTSLALESIKLQYCILQTDNILQRDIKNWIEFGEGANGIIDITDWSQFSGQFLYVRAYAEDELGNAAYSGLQKRIISANNFPPVSNAGSDQEVNENTNVVLDGSQSYDQDGDSLTFEWIQLSGPDVSLSNNGSYSAWFISPQICPNNAYLKFQLTVIDENGLSDNDICSISIICNHAPSAPVLSSPIDGSINEPYPIELKISNSHPFVDKDQADYHMSTQWQISNTNDFNLLILDITDSSNQKSLLIQDLILDEGIEYFWRVRFFDNHYLPSEWSDTFSFKTQINTIDISPKNGIPDDLEVVDKTIDLDENNIPDVEQIDGTFKCIMTLDQKSQISVKALENVSYISTIKTTNKSVIDDEKNKPGNMPYGLINFKLYLDNPGYTARIQFYFDTSIPDNSQWFKYDPVKGWYDYSEHMRKNSKSVIIDFVDGGHGDADGLANGIIVDPSGLVVPSTSKPPKNDEGGGCYISVLSNQILYHFLGKNYKKTTGE